MQTNTVQTYRVPPSLLTSSNCMAIPNDWDYSYGTPGTTFKAGDMLVVDLDACPKVGDIVVMKRAGSKPFGRLCHVAPFSVETRERWLMGVLDDDGQTVHVFRLGEYEWIGVVTGKIPSGTAS